MTFFKTINYKYNLIHAAHRNFAVSTDIFASRGRKTTDDETTQKQIHRRHPDGY